MLDDTPTPTAPRPWQEVAKERGISLRILGDLIGRTHSTMLAYSSNKRVPPQDVLSKMSRMLGETVK